MSWQGPEDAFLSTSLASYLDSILLSLFSFYIRVIELLDLLLKKTLSSNSIESQVHLFVLLVTKTPNLSLISTEKLLVLLRDGRKLSGILRSFDQYANAVLEGACERVIVGDLYCDIPLGLYVIRGENVVLVGELDVERDDLPSHMTRVSTSEIKRAQKAEREAMDLKGMIRKRMEFLDLD
ncbi:hypothetical protein V2J09_004636 [Rumex salicifolius]